METIESFKYKKKSLIITSLGTFLGTLDASIVNVSLPTISRELNTSVDMVGWVVLSYVIVIISLLAVFGAFAEKKGFQFSYRYGFAVFLLGSLLCGMSVSVEMLIAARAIQGIGAALLMSVGPALITRSFPENERGKGLSVIAMVVSVGLLMGPPLGGYIIGLAGWRWIFFVNIPVSLLGIILTYRFIGNFPIPNPAKKISYPGAISLALGILSSIITIMIYSKGIISTGLMIGSLTVSTLILGLFIYFENKPKTQLIGIAIFKNRIFTFSSLAVCLVFISLTSITVLMPFYLEKIKGFQPQDVGLYLMIIPICTLFTAPFAGALSDKIQARIISTLGILIMSLGIYITRNLGADSTAVDIIKVLVIIGVGMGLFNTPNTSSIMGSVDKKQLGVAAGINATIRNLGIVMGVTLAIAIYEFFRNKATDLGQGDMQAFIFGYQSVYTYIIIVILAAAVASWLRGNNFHKDRDIKING